jgi:hypothetical protein
LGTHGRGVGFQHAIQALSAVGTPSQRISSAIGVREAPNALATHRIDEGRRQRAVHIATLLRHTALLEADIAGGTIRRRRAPQPTELPIAVRPVGARSVRRTTRFARAFGQLAERIDDALGVHRTALGWVLARRRNADADLSRTTFGLHPTDVGATVALEADLAAEAIGILRAFGGLTDPTHARSARGTLGRALAGQSNALVLQTRKRPIADAVGDGKAGVAGTRFTAGASDDDQGQQTAYKMVVGAHVDTPAPTI